MASSDERFPSAGGSRPAGEATIAKNGGLVRLRVVLLLSSAVFCATAYGQLEAGGRLLIVAADSFCEAVQPLAEWRTATGQQAAVVPLSQAGSTPSEVRTFIRNAWSTWPVQPEYVLLFCNPTQLQGYSYDNDCYYGDMTGDWRMEIPVGRLPAWSVSEARLMVAKVLAYERLSGWTDTTWLTRGSTTVQEGNPSDPDSFYLPDCYFVHGLWLANGYTRTDTFYSEWGHNSTDLDSALNDGRTFITYRGSASGTWRNPFDQFLPGPNWHNGFRMPILVAGACATVTLVPGEEMLGDKSVRFGTLDSLGGAVAYFGTSRSASVVSRYRSACMRGFFHGLFADSLIELGPATVRGRQWIDSMFQNQTRYLEWTLIGDPAMRVWTGLPRPLTVTHPAWVSAVPQELAVGVTSAGSPVANAFVCVWLDSVVYALDTTDSSGNVVLSIAPDHPGLIRITVTGRDLAPYEGTCEVHVTGAPYVVYLRHEVIDSFPAGNSDGFVGAGETITAPTWLRNFGDSTASGVQVRLRCADSNVVLLDSVRYLGTVLPHDSAATGRNGFRFRVDPACPDGRELLFRVHTSDTVGRAWDADFVETVVTIALSFVRDTVRDSAGNRNGRLDPNETADLIVTLHNAGSGTALQTTAWLRSSDPRLIVLDSAGSWGDIPGHSSGDNNADRFTVHAAEMVPATPILCTLVVSSPCYSARLLFTITPGVLSPTDPCCDGPRVPSLYWAYDNVDSTYAEHPAYNWVEARGIGTNLALRDNHTVGLDLPVGFGPFKYYGRRYEELSVCSNGWIAPGVSTFIGWENLPLPQGIEPPMLAVGWNDLIPDTIGNVWWLFDSASHRLVIEWDSVPPRGMPTHRDKFEVVIYDTTLAAADGNNEFDYQYQTGGVPSQMTVGIQDPSDSVGITTLFDGAYGRAAAHLQTGRCIRFTTDPPIVGLAELAGLAPGRVTTAATIVRGVLRLSSDECRLSIGGLLDMTGRKVLDLKPGPNDVGGLAPGVYFVRETRAQAQAVRKVVIAR